MAKNLLEEAIAEAKTVRETAIANAKEALAESFTPHLKSMIAAKLEEEMGLEDDEFGTEDIHADGMMEVEEPTGEEGMEGMDPEEELPGEPEEELPAEEPIEEPEGEEGMEDDREIGDLSVDEFKDLLKDLLGQMSGEPEEELPAEEPIEEPEGEEGMELEPEQGIEPEEEEEISLDELLREMEQEDESLYENKKAESLELEKTKQELRSTKVQLSEAFTTVKKLQKELQGINLLNAKLLYTTKVLKVGTLSESQKIDIITAFDSADTIKEAKLIYQTVSSQIVEESKKKAVKTPIAESVRRGMASQSISTPKVKPVTEVLLEADETVRRMQKLAGITQD